MNRDIIERNVRLLLSCRGMSQEALAVAMAITRSRIGAMLARPTDAAIERIADALGVPVEWLEDENLAERSARELRGE